MEWVKMAKNQGYGKGEIFTARDYDKFFKVVENSNHRLICHILRYTGERIGAVVQLQVSDCYSDPKRAIALKQILFRGSTRKKSPSGGGKTRQVPIHSVLRQQLENYRPPADGWLFPSSRNPERHITADNCDDWFNRYLKKAGLESRGFSLHSFRRTFITELAKAGVPVPTIKKITGHSSLSALQEYIDIDEDSILKALNML